MNKEQLLEVAKQIRFNTEEVRAILDGRKTVTRITIPRNWFGQEDTDKNDPSYLYFPDKYGDYHHAKDLCRHQPGDILYVRETFCEVPYEYEHIPMKNGHITVPKIAYRADSEIDYTGIWKPSIHMPKELARIFLKVTDVRVERLQEHIKDSWEYEKEGLWGYSADYRDEICKNRDSLYGLQQTRIKHFKQLWNSTIKKKDLNLYGWNANPWVWVIEFERAEVAE